MTIKHPTICFGISRHNVIIPLRVTEIEDFQDGCYRYKFAVNHPKPSEYMQCHQNASFDAIYISTDRPLCDEHTKVRLTLAEAKELVTKQLKRDRNTAQMQINSIDKTLNQIDTDTAALSDAIEQDVAALPEPNITLKSA
jgi:hypothetical protein